VAKLTLVRSNCTFPIHSLLTFVWLVWDRKPSDTSCPINWVELKTAAQVESDRDQIRFERKLLKFWAQSFLLGVPKIVVGFRTKDGILTSLEEVETRSIPDMVRRGKQLWDGNICINFAAAFLECKISYLDLISIQRT
jgi:RAT1-interacting protein